MESRVVLFGGQYQVNHTEMMQAENGSADMCGSTHRIEEAALHRRDLMFPWASHKKLSVNFWVEIIFHRFDTAYVKAGPC